MIKIEWGTIKVWDNKDQIYLKKDEFNLAINFYGMVNEYEACSSGGDTWLSRDGTGDRYEIHYDTSFAEE